MTGQPCIFGTDGIRDRAGDGFLSFDEVTRIIDATASMLTGSDPACKGDTLSSTVLIGRDTRCSGEDLEKTIAAACSRVGLSVRLLGVIPTPAVALLASRDPAACLGVMVSASHNPAEYNGIKFLAPSGAKMSSEFEEAASLAYWQRRRLESTGGQPGVITEDAAAARRDYVAYLVESCRNPAAIRGRRVALDMANGATVDVAREVFEALGATVISLGDHPDGRNINAGCGALHPEVLARRVVDDGADFGFAFDGDGDRMIPVTEKGTILDGDYVMAIAGRHLHRSGRLPGRTVVSTVMSNIGLEKALTEAGLRLIRTRVGDRYVYDCMIEQGHPLGGEQSGHLIFLDDARTGDGVLAALRLIDCLEGGSSSSLEAASRLMRKYPQVLLNYPVARKVPLEELEGVREVVTRAQSVLAGDGRIVLRYSGTEPLARVMVEGPEQGLIDELARDIGAAIVAEIGA